MKDAWKSGDPYEYFMGRWGSLVARSFAEWLSPPSGLRWLDVGYGSGALSQAALDSGEPAAITAVDQSAGFVEGAQRRLGGRARRQRLQSLCRPVLRRRRRHGLQPGRTRPPVPDRPLMSHRACSSAG